jgi:Carboxyl transferase domain
MRICAFSVPASTRAAATNTGNAQRSASRQVKALLALAPLGEPDLLRVGERRHPIALDPVSPEGAVNIIYRKDIANSPTPDERRQKLIDDYKAHFANPYAAAERGYIDDVIEPTRPGRS